jgi:type IV secretion system protein VirB8
MKDQALEAYFAEAASWDADRAAQSRRITRIAWIVASAGWLAALASAAALMLLMPLKRVEPFVLRVDNSTGLVDVVPVYAGHADMPEAVTRYFLDHYVTVCERFNFATAESDYEECGAYHTAARNQTTVRAQVSSISFFERSNGVSDLAQARYTKAKRAAGGTDEQVTHWIATVQYTYGEPSKDPKVRHWNPLGFKVVEFKSEPEVLAEPSAVVASEPGAGGRTP